MHQTSIPGGMTEYGKRDMDFVGMARQEFQDANNGRLPFTAAECMAVTQRAMQIKQENF
jgi:hypothetical protein